MMTKLPTAYEEVWNGISGTGVVGAASADTLGYRNTFAGLTVSLAYNWSIRWWNCWYW